MQLDIFEAPGYGLDTDMDVLLVNLKRKFSTDIGIRKISISNKEEVKKHKDVVQKLASDGFEVLPIIKLDGKIINNNKLEALLYKKLG